MKAPFIAAILAMLVLAGQPGEIRADVNGFSIFNVANYHQIDGTQPATLDVPNAYYFGAQLGSDTNNNYGATNDSALTNAFFFTPDGNEYFMTTSDDFYYFYNSPFFTNETDLDSAFIPGDYQFNVNDAADTGDVIVPANTLYSDDIPFFTGDTWTNMQSVDPFEPFTLMWNNFTPNPGATEAFIFVRIFDQNGFSPYSANFLPPGDLSTNIPAGTLSPGVTYTVQLFFSDRTNDVDGGFASGVSGVVGFDNLTYTTMITQPLVLNITPAGTNVVLSWTAEATNFVLQAASQLAPTNGWTTITNMPAVINGQNLLTNATSSAAEFFRLKQKTQP